MLATKPSKAKTMVPASAPSTSAAPAMTLVEAPAAGGGGAGASSSAAYEDLNSWREIEEDEFGNLLVADASHDLQRERRRLLLDALSSKRLKRGMIRFVQLVVDLSRATAMTDFRPSRLAVLSHELERFVELFFEQNPLSQLALVVTRGGMATQLTELSGSPHSHVGRLKSLGLSPHGDASIQNALDVAVRGLSFVPPYGHREVLFVSTSLTSCDPGDVFASIKHAAKQNCRCSVVGLGAEVVRREHAHVFPALPIDRSDLTPTIQSAFPLSHQPFPPSPGLCLSLPPCSCLCCCLHHSWNRPQYVLRRLADLTQGTYRVATSEQHLRDLLRAHAPPPPQLKDAAPSSLVQMGFPAEITGGSECFVGQDSEVRDRSFQCPRCKSRARDLPGACHVCGLALVSSAHLARSYHHLFPVPLFDEVGPGDAAEGWEGRGESGRCFACGRSIGGAVEKGGDRAAMAAMAVRGGGGAGLVLRCPQCLRCFCIDCDVFIHEHVHTCPGCEEDRTKPPANAAAKAK